MKLILRSAFSNFHGLSTSYKESKDEGGGEGRLEEISRQKVCQRAASEKLEGHGQSGLTNLY